MPKRLHIQQSFGIGNRKIRHYIEKITKPAEKELITTALACYKIEKAKSAQNMPAIQTINCFKSNYKARLEGCRNQGLNMNNIACIIE